LISERSASTAPRIATRSGASSTAASWPSCAP